MAEPSEPLEPQEEEGEGGAVKSFLEHLEDLRWMIIKCAAAVIAGMMICLFATPQLAVILKWPLRMAAHRKLVFMPVSTNTVVRLRFGDSTLQSITLASNKLGSFDLGTNHQVDLQLEPVQVGSNTLFSLRVVRSQSDEDMNTPQLYYMGPADSFFSVIHIAFFGGLFLASPFVMYFVGQFVLPALRRIEKKYFLKAFWFGITLFLSGVLFAYFVLMPPAVKFAELMASTMDISSQIWKAEDFFSFEIKFMLGMGLGFELPVVLLALVKIGLLNYAKLTAMRRYMIVANLVLGGLLTTPEVFTQIVMAIALQMLFEVAVWIAWYWEYQEKKRRARNAPIDV